MAHIDLTATSPLRCIAAGCTASPQGTKGWHLVHVRQPETGEVIAAAPGKFTCTEHLPEVEQAVVEHMREHAVTAWQVETFRMYGWEDDGRGAAYVTASGDLTTLALF